MYYQTTQIYDKNQEPITALELKSLHLKGLNSFYLCPKSEISQSTSKKRIHNLAKSITRKKLQKIDVCPFCGARLIGHGTRLRSFKDESCGKTYYLFVRRKYCTNCKTSWTVLPQFLQPYKIIVLLIIYIALKDYLQDENKPSVVPKSTVQRWYLQFYQAATAYSCIRKSHLFNLLEGLFYRSFLTPTKGLSFFQDVDLFTL